MMTIRLEAPGDRETIFEVHRAAFGRDGEPILVDRLRHSSAFVAQLSLVALDRGDGDSASLGIVGHILFTRIVVQDAGATHDALALAPLAVMPAHQRKGTGSALVARGLEDARQLGHRIVIVVGHPEYYRKFGFRPAALFGIRPPFEVPREAFMALELQSGALQGVTGEVKYPVEFDQV